MANPAPPWRVRYGDRIAQTAFSCIVAALGYLFRELASIKGELAVIRHQLSEFTGGAPPAAGPDAGPWNGNLSLVALLAVWTLLLVWVARRKT